MLRADSVSFRYHADTPLVVDGVTLDVQRGDLVGILGPNGSGKTSLLRLLSGTRTPVSGKVWLDELEMAKLSRRDIARRLAVVPQETELAFDYTALELVLMGRHPHLGVLQLEGPHDYALAREALAATGIAHLESRAFHTLSGGEKQRVVIAAALAQSSEVLLLDEPTASLDLGAQLDVATLLGNLNASRQVTMVVSTHDLNLAASLCRTLVMMRQGRVLASGPTDTVLTGANVRALYDVDADVHVHAETGHMTVVPVRRLRP
ncbi:MAG: ABC transporter ATP-binding protein [Acidobacteria bacterium]|nr:ABC transporter ATP-binding protein [Acidobacteriota bacterium]